MKIRRLAQEDPPMDLLLDADPSRELVNAYLQKGITFVAEENRQIIGVYVLMTTEKDNAEIMNIAVSEERQGQGIGRSLLRHAIDHSKKKGCKKIQIATGNSSIGQIALYQKCGFRIIGIDFDYFIENYAEPIYENGILCRDRIRMEMNLQGDEG